MGTPEPLRSGRQNKAHHYLHEQHVDPTTFKGTGGRPDEMSVWGLQGRIHTEAAYFEDLSGFPVFVMNFVKDGQLIDPLTGDGIPIPTLPLEKTINTHASVTHVAGTPSGDSFTLWLLDKAGTLIASSPTIALAATIQCDCFIWTTPQEFALCDAWAVIGFLSIGDAVDVQIRLVNEFVARKGGA